MLEEVEGQTNRGESDGPRNGGRNFLLFNNVFINTKW